MSEDFLTVSQLNQRINDVIQMRFTDEVWVCGEIQGFRQARSGHVYFDLVEKEEGSSKITAKITAAIFANRKFQIQNTLKKSENAFQLKDDIEVKFVGRVNFYEPYGTISFIIEDIDPTYTLGRLAQEKQKLIAELKKKGVLEQNKRIPLPMVPLKIGLITSHQSAAFEDFTSELIKSTIGFQIHLRNTLMQGKNSEQDVVKAIDALERIKDLDLIVITRGGGSAADLSDFDSKLIAERMARAGVPVLSGIGHEIDLSITDLAAHTYAKTPTAIAQFLVGRVEKYLMKMDEYYDDIVELVTGRVQGQKQYLKEIAFSLQDKTMRYLQSHRERIVTYSEALKHKPLQHFKESKQKLKNASEAIDRVTKNRFKQEQARLKGLAQTIEAYHPANTLKRGFSITRTKEGKLVRSTTDINTESTLITEVVGGKIESDVKSIKKEKKDG